MQESIEDKLLSAEDRARGLAIDAVRRRRSRPWIHASERFLVRGGRLVLGAVLTLAAVWACDAVPSLSDRAIGSLTLREITSAIFLVALMFGLLALAFNVAFGEAPDRTSIEAESEAHMRWAREEIQRRDRRAAEDAQHAARRAKATSFGRKVALALTRRHW